MAIDAMTTGNLYQQGQAPEVKASPATMEAVKMGRMRIGPKIPQAVLEKTGLAVGDRIPEDWDADQVERWNRRGYLVVDGGRARETAQAGATRETRAKKPAGLTLDQLERSGSWYIFPDGSKANGEAAARAKLEDWDG